MPEHKKLACVRLAQAGAVMADVWALFVVLLVVIGSVALTTCARP
jgi:hypothetical protein